MNQTPPPSHGPPHGHHAIRTITALCTLIVAVAIAWVSYSFLISPSTRESVNRLASGVGVPIVPWTSRARTAANTMYQTQGATIAHSIRSLTHPSGTGGNLANFSVTVRGDQLISRFDVSWNGGFLGTSYVTTVEWRCSQSGNTSARVSADNAIIGVAADNAAQLDNYFSAEVYPTLVHNAN